MNNIEVIGIDHGWSLIKTINSVFVSGVKEITSTPATFKDTVLYEGKYYKVGCERLEVKDTKVEDNKFYILTLAAIAKELKRRGNIRSARVFIAAGLPLTRFGAEKSDFLRYLLQNKRVEFEYENTMYNVIIEDAAIFPQCYAAVVDRMRHFTKKTLVVDIGSWTVDMMPVVKRAPDESRCITEHMGIITCIRTINEQCVRKWNGRIEEDDIQQVMRFGSDEGIDEKYLKIIESETTEFVNKVYNSIREYGYNLNTTPIVFVGGGASVMKRYGDYNQDNITFIQDIKANAKGYEYLARMGLKKRGEML